MASELYNSFFGFSERPFTLLPDPDFLFWSRNHKRAYAVLEYGIQTNAQVTLVTGAIGAGKTTLVQQLIGGLDEHTTVGLISNAQGGRGDLLRWVLYALEIPDSSEESDYIAQFKKFQDFVIAEYAAGRHVLLVIDEAQNLSVEALEELRMLTNINSHKHELLQLMLVGQPELHDLISRPELTQFAQRVTATFHLNPLDIDQTRDYIQHRLRHVGGTGEEFSRYAIQTIFSESEGVPRVINKLCDLALVYAASGETHQVDGDVIQELISDGLLLKTRKYQDIHILRNPINTVASKAAE